VKRNILLTSLGAALWASALAVFSAEPSAQENTANAIRGVIQSQQEAWNRGDIDAFMKGYWESAKTIFVSGDEVTRGWQPVHDRYKEKYSDREKMGTLTFSEIEIMPLAVDAAVVLGRWELKRANDNPHGRFTLIFRQTAQGWRIVQDHTSAAEAPPQ
jgi:uncharacterized protein (TIGR02246 family)